MRGGARNGLTLLVVRLLGPLLVPVIGALFLIGIICLMLAFIY